MKIIGSGGIGGGDIGSGKIPASFGSLFENSAGTDIVIATPGTFVKWTGATVGNQSGPNFVVGSAVNDDMTINKYGPGDYEGNYIATVKIDPNQCLVAGLFKNNVLIDESRKRETSSGLPEIFLDTLALSRGTLNGGTVADTRRHDGKFFDIQEVTGAPGFRAEGQATDKEKLASVVELIYTYNLASTGHVVKAAAFDRVGMTWVPLTGFATDFPPNLGIQDKKRFSIPGTLANYYNANGEILLEVNHTSNGIVTHQFLIDKFAMIRDASALTISGKFNEALVEGDVIDLRFTCPINTKTIYTTDVTVNINRVDK